MITNGRLSIGTTAVAIDGVHNQPAHMIIHNDDNTQAVYLGGPGVTAADGLTIEKLESLQFDLGPLEQVYAVSTKTNHTISWMRQTL